MFCIQDSTNQLHVFCEGRNWPNAPDMLLEVQLNALMTRTGMNQDHHALTGKFCPHLLTIFYPTWYLLQYMSINYFLWIFFSLALLGQKPHIYWTVSTD